MRSHDQSLDVTLKLRKTKLLVSKTRSNQSPSRWPRVAISCAKRPYNKAKGTEKNPIGSRSAAIDTNDELFCENSDVSEETTICPRISSSTGLEENDDVCSTCKNCTEYHLQKQQSNAPMKKRGESEEGLINIQELAEHLDYYEGDVDGEMTSSSSTIFSIEREDIPILVDLTNEESKQVTRKQTILKQFEEDEESSKPGENVVTKSNIVMYTCHFVIRQGDDMQMTEQLRQY